MCIRDSHYPLQAHIYLLALHRFLNWRLPDYSPQKHLGGYIYVFLRGLPDKEELEEKFLAAHWKEFAEEGSAPIDDNWTTDDYEEFYTTNDGIIYVDHYYQSITPIHLEEVAK